MGALASVVAVVHGLAVLFMLTGALLALRWPRLVLLHAPVALAILAVNLAGADCPLTDLELALRGTDGYDGGFLGHYFFGPLGLDEHAHGTQLGTYGTALGLNALGYGLVLSRRRGRPARAGATTPASTAPCAPGTRAA